MAAPRAAARAPRKWGPLDAYSLRAVAGLLLVSVPVSILLGFAMANWSSQTSIDSAKARAEATAESAAVRITDFVAERRAQLRSVAQNSLGNLAKPGLNAHLLASFQAQSSFDGIQIYDRNAKSIAATDPGGDLSPTPSGSSFANSLSVETMGPVVIRAATDLDWIMTAPIVGSDSKPQGVVVGNLNVAVLGRLLNPYGLDVSTVADQEIHLINAQRLLLYSSDWGVIDERRDRDQGGAQSARRKRDLRPGDEGGLRCGADRRLPEAAGSRRL